MATLTEELDFSEYSTLTLAMLDSDNNPYLQLEDPPKPGPYSAPADLAGYPDNSEAIKWGMAPLGAGIYKLVETSNNSGQLTITEKLGTGDPYTVSFDNEGVSTGWAMATIGYTESGVAKTHSIACWKIYREAGISEYYIKIN